MNASCQKLTLCSLGAGLLLLGLPGIAAPAEGATPLIDKVHSATARYIDINVAIAEGFVRATPCVSGPNAGARGRAYKAFGDRHIDVDVARRGAVHLVDQRRRALRWRGDARQPQQEEPCT